MDITCINSTDRFHVTQRTGSTFKRVITSRCAENASGYRSVSFHSINAKHWSRKAAFYTVTPPLLSSVSNLTTWSVMWFVTAGVLYIQRLHWQRASKSWKQGWLIDDLQLETQVSTVLGVGFSKVILTEPDFPSVVHKEWDGSWSVRPDDQRDKKAKKGCQIFLDDPLKQRFCVGYIWKPFLICYRLSSGLSALALQPRLRGGDDRFGSFCFLKSLRSLIRN